MSAVLEVFEQATGPLKTSEIAYRARTTPQNVRQPLDRLREAGRILRVNRSGVAEWVLVSK